MAKNSLQKLLEAGVQFGDMSRQQAERAVKRLVKAGDVRRSETEAMVQTLLERGRETTTRVAELVQQEVAKQIGWMANRVDDLEDQLEALVGRLSSGGRGPVVPAPAPEGEAWVPEDEDLIAEEDGFEPPVKKAPAKKKAAAKKAPAKKKAAAKKAPAKKKAAAKKAPAKQRGAAKKAPAARKATAKKAPSKRSSTRGAVGSSGVRKVATSRPGG